MQYIMLSDHKILILDYKILLDTSIKLITGISVSCSF